MTVSDAVDRIRLLVGERYVLPDVAERLVSSLREAESEHDPAGPPELVARHLSARLAAVSNDKHLAVLHLPQGSEPAARWRSRRTWRVPS